MIKISMNADTMKGFCKCISTDKTRLALWNISVRPDGGLVATDGARLCYVPRSEYSPDTLEPGTYKLMGKAIKEGKYVSSLIVEKTDTDFPNVEQVNQGYIDANFKCSTADTFELSRTAYSIYKTFDTALNVALLQDLPEDDFSLSLKTDENGRWEGLKGVKLTAHNGAYFLIMPIRMSK